MGTRGYFAFRYKSRYYVVFSQFDSYFSGLGCDLIQAIKQLTKEQWEQIKEKLTTFPINRDTCEDVVPRDMKRDENILLTVMDSYIGTYVTYSEPKLDFWIEYVYILDLDVDVFTTISKYYEEDIDYEIRYTCRFENLTKEWLLNVDSE